MKLRKILICTAAACMLLFCSAAASLSPEAAAAYQNVLNDLAGRYGNAWTASANSPMSGMYFGLSCARLIDFDGDGMPELYCAYGVSSTYAIRQVLYTYDGGLIDLEIPSKVSNFGTDVSPSTLLYVGADRAYLVDGQEIMNGGTVSYLTKQGNQMSAELTYVYGIMQDTPEIQLNGADASEDELQAALDALTAGMTEADYWFWSSSEGLDPTGTIAETLQTLREALVAQAVPAAQRVRIDGKEWVIPAYVIHETNYFKLRDLAAVLNGTSKQFAVGWDGQFNQVSITTGQRYALKSGELAALPQGTAEAERAASSLVLDGEAFSPEAYVIGAGYHYYKLRDLAAALGVAVEWDAADKTIVLTTS